VGDRTERLFARAAAALVPFAVAALVFCGVAQAKPRQYQVAPVPDWVQPIRLAPAGDLQPDAKDGTEYLLVDRQIRVHDGWSEYQRYVSRLANPAGAQDASQVTIDFDPQLDRLILHAVEVRRGTHVVDELRHGRIEVLQRESELEQGILDGSLTFHLLMTDVRVGDIIDVSYTIERRDPAFRNRFFERLTTRWDDPVARSHLRVLFPATAPLSFAGSERTAPVRRREGAWRSLEWDWKPLPGIVADADAPSWYEQHPAIEFSQFKDWGEVVRASLPLFSFDARDADLLAQSERLQAGTRTQSERALAALRFVQEKIRYTGLELGAGAYRPRPPGEVLRSRYGDCKDKALLAAALLRVMGIDAAPALVSTRWEGHLNERLPSPGDFDHAVVRLRLGGKTYWVDVTETGQGGVLETLDQADYGSALVIAPRVTELESIPFEPPAQPLVEAAAVFDLRAGTDAEGSYAISTTYRGSEADALRRKLRYTSPAELGKNYLNYYRSRYPGIRAVGPPDIHDDPLTNQITVNESYRIAHPFESKDSGEKRFELEAEVIHDDAQRPSQPARVAPLAIDHGVYSVERITIRFPSFFPVKDEVVSIDPPAFHYESRLTHSGNDVVFEARFKTLVDVVPRDQLDDFLKKVEQVRGDSSLWFTTGSAPSQNDATAASDELAKAIALTKKGRSDDADAAFTKLLASPGFDGLTAAQRHAALLVAGAVAMDKGDHHRALDLLKRACGTEQAGAPDWKLRVYAAQRDGDFVDAGYALATLAQRWPDTLKAIDIRVIGRTLHGLPDAGTSRYELLSALQAAKYDRETLDLTRWWRDLALLQLERGDSDKARATAAQVTDPYSLVSMQADNRFASVRQYVPDIATDVEQQIRRMQGVVASKPDELEPVLQLGELLLASSRFDQALRLMDGVIATVNGPKGRKAYVDADTKYAWILDTRSRALLCLGRWDEAVAQLLSASHLPEVQGDNVSQVINLAGLYNDLGRPQEARATLSGLPSTDMSPFGRMQETIEIIASADELGDAAEVERQLAYARDHRSDSPASYEQALISANRLDEAARVLIGRLEDPSQRIDALMEVQDYKAFPLPPRARKIRLRWESVIQRPDVRAAIERVGNIGSYPLIREAS
jgi:transglutaminase-like putative cysteine protease